MPEASEAKKPGSISTTSAPVTETREKTVETTEVVESAEVDKDVAESKVFRMPFPTLSGVDVNFLGRELW